jgi:hypothetical protein
VSEGGQRTLLRRLLAEALAHAVGHVDGCLGGWLVDWVWNCCLVSELKSRMCDESSLKSSVEESYKHLHLAASRQMTCLPNKRTSQVIYGGADGTRQLRQTHLQHGDLYLTCWCSLSSTLPQPRPATIGQIGAYSGLVRCYLAPFAWQSVMPKGQMAQGASGNASCLLVT